MTVGWKAGSWGVVKSTVYSNVNLPACECHPRIKSRDAYVKHRAKSQVCQGLSQAYVLMPSVALVCQLFALTQELIPTYLTKDWGSYLVEEDEVSEHRCIEKSRK